MEFLGEEAKKAEAAAPADPGPAAEISKPRARRSNKLSESLKGLPTVVREIVHPDVLAAPGEFRLLGEEVSERLHVKPSAFTLEIIRRLTHVRKDGIDAVPVTAPLAPCLLPGSVLTPSLGAYLLTRKFCYHSTFYREQWKLKAGHGIELTRNLMCSWHDHLAERLLPLHQLIAARIRRSDYIRVDETPVRCLEPGSGKTASGYFWVYHHDEHGVLFDWHTSRANTCMDNILIGEEGDTPFHGYLQSDGLRAYRTFINRHPDQVLVPVSCLAHIARKFKETRSEFPRIGARVLLLIGEIYQVEKRMDARDAHPLDRQRVRWLESRKPYDHLRKLVRRVIRFRGITPGSGFYKALHYAIEQLPHLEPCFLDGQIRFDNNRTENAIRPTKLGHKNWMFIGGEHTGWRSAVIYTFVEQVRRHGADPFAYFEWVFEKLTHNPPPEQLAALLPCEWIKARSTALRTAEARIA
ncbi:MAG: IS66 family transposase [Verrucomicrobia bacterium]|nr:IS66 family transposase [Verrucomicrobiota bacterium]